MAEAEAVAGSEHRRTRMEDREQKSNTMIKNEFHLTAFKLLLNVTRSLLASPPPVALIHPSILPTHTIAGNGSADARSSLYPCELTFKGTILVSGGVEWSVGFS